MRDYYEILGVSKNASENDIKKAFHQLAHKYHPDKQGGDEKKFKEVNEAYQVLSNKEKRAQYDRFGKTFSGAGGGAGGQQGPFGFNQQGFEGFDFSDIFSGADGAGFNGAGFDDLGDIFGNIFGGGGRSTRRKRGADIQADISVTLEEAFSGTHKDISFRTHVECTECKGIGYEKSSGTVTCDVCKGTGKVRQQKNSFLGSFMQVRECEKCGGKGEIPKKICHVCKGSGRIMGERKADIDIKAGIQSGQMIKISGLGEAGMEGHPAGDLYIRVMVSPHKVFTVDGENLVMKKEIKFSDVLLGKEFEINSVDGRKIKFSVPASHDLRDDIRIPKEGMARRGNLIVKLSVKTPRRMSSGAKRLAEELARELDGDE